MLIGLLFGFLVLWGVVSVGGFILGVGIGITQEVNKSKEKKEGGK